MNEYLQKAKELLEEQAKEKQTNVKAQTIAPYVKEVLLQFAEAEPEFAQAIVQSTGTFTDCCEKIGRDIGGHCSDKDVYQAAAEFYFPGSKVKFEMKIDLVGEEAKPEPIVIDFTDFC